MPEPDEPQGDPQSAENKAKNQIERPKANELMVLLGDYAEVAAGQYKPLLVEEARDEEERLGVSTQERLNDHIKQFDILLDIFRRIKDGEPFVPVVQVKKVFPRHDGSARETYSIRLAPKGEQVKSGEEGGQNQLSLHLNIDATESALDIIHALSIKGFSPDKVLDYFRQSAEQIVDVNTVNAYIPEDSGRIRINPQAGFTMRWYRGEERARMGGLTYQGLTPHVADLRVGVAKPQFTQFQKAIMLGSGTQQPKVMGDRDY